MTGAQQTAFYAKQLLSGDQLSTYGLRYQADLVDTLLSLLYGEATLYQTTTGAVGGGLLTVSPDGLRATDGAGKVLQLSGAARRLNVPYERTNGVLYHFALRYQQVPAGVETAPRSGLPAYPYLLDEVGELATPTSVVAAGLGLTVCVDSLCGPGALHSLAGRAVAMWRVSPRAATLAVAYEAHVVAWDGVHNYITTVGTFGGATAADLVYTAASYQVFLPGVSVSRTTAFGAGYAVLGRATNDVFSTTGQSPTTVVDLADLSQVVEFDGHGFPKIRVQADAADANQRQLSVLSFAGAEVFKVTEGGLVTIVTGAGLHGLTLGDGSGNSPRVYLKHAAGDYYLAGFDGTLNLHSTENANGLLDVSSDVGGKTFGLQADLLISQDTLTVFGAATIYAGLEVRYDTTFGFAGAALRVRGTNGTVGAKIIQPLAGADDLLQFVTTAAALLLSVNRAGQLVSALAPGTAPFTVASTTLVENLNADLLEGADWGSPLAIGGTLSAAAAFTTISATGQITSTLAIGTAPLLVTSTTKVINLNADKLDGNDWSAPGPIGGTTPDTGAFTTLHAAALLALNAVTGDATGGTGRGGYFTGAGSHTALEAFGGASGTGALIRVADGAAGIGLEVRAPPTSTGGVGLYLVGGTGSAPLNMEPQTKPSAAQKGDMYIDNSGDLWINRADGSGSAGGTDGWWKVSLVAH